MARIRSLVVVGGTVRCWDDTQGAAAAAILDAQADGGTLTGALDLAVADHTGCAILTNAVACWGEGFAGALGDGSTLAHETTAAVRVLGSNGTGSLTDAVMIDGRGYGFCVIRSGGTVWCWGDAVSEPGGSGYPTATGVSSAVDVAVGDLHVCALHQDGSVSCWGSNQFGQLGGGTIGGNSETPVKVLGL